MKTAVVFLALVILAWRIAQGAIDTWAAWRRG
jgi:hypothetical protein